MLALKKKREAEAKAKAEAAVQQQMQSPGEVDETTTPQQAASTTKVSLLGIGGKKNDKNNEKSSGKKRTPGEIRIQKDIEELDGGKVATVEFPNPNDLTIFHVYVTPDSGFWKGATYLFHFVIPDHYVSDI
jgi:ubiquitin-conjugating enzyme E2 M